MCGRFIRQGDIDKIIREFGVQTVSCSLAPSYNIAPTQEIAVVIEDGAKQLTTVKWGLVPSWAGDMSGASRMINARAESILQKPAFKDAFRRRRCLVVADGFYEWQKDGRNKRPIFIGLKTGQSFGFAGIYEDWTSPEGHAVRTCAIITTEANELMRPIHDRMPVIIPRGQEDLWLDCEAEGSDHGVVELLELLRPYPAEEMETHQVSNLVNSVANDSRECLLPPSQEVTEHPLLPFE